MGNPASYPLVEVSGYPAVLSPASTSSAGALRYIVAVLEKDGAAALGAEPGRGAVVAIGAMACARPLLRQLEGNIGHLMNEREEVIQLMKQTFLRVAPRDQASGVRRFFAEATIAAGLLGLEGDPGTPLARGLAVGVADDDPVLGPVFSLRDRLGDRELEQAWQIQTVRWGFLSHPSDPKALLRFHVVADLRPPTASRKAWVQRISRALLLDPFLLEAPLLRRFNEPGCLIWLIPESVASREAGRRGRGSMYDVLSYCLPVGAITEGPATAVEQALSFVTGHR